MSQPIEIPNAPSNPYDELDLLYVYSDKKSTCPFCLGLGVPWGGWFSCESESCGTIALVSTGQAFRPTSKRCAITIDRCNYAGMREASDALDRLRAFGWVIVEVEAERDIGRLGLGLHTPRRWRLKRLESPILPTRDHYSVPAFLRADMQPDVRGFTEAVSTFERAQIAETSVSSWEGSPILDSAHARARSPQTAKIDSEDGAQANSSSTVEEAGVAPPEKDL